MGRLALGIPGRRHYLSALRSIFGNGLIALWLQNEQAGSVCRDYSPYGHNGTYSGVTLAAARGPRGLWAPTYDGINDYNNIYSTSLVSVFNGAEGTLIVWAKVSGAGVWTDGVVRALVTLSADANNFVQVSKRNINDTLWLQYKAGGTLKTGGITTNSTGWLAIAMSWSATSNLVQYYLNGSAVGPPGSDLGTWAGQLASTATVIGAQNTTPQYVWSGAIGPVVLLNKAATAAQIAAAYRLGLPTGA